MFIGRQRLINPPDKGQTEPSKSNETSLNSGRRFARPLQSSSSSRLSQTQELFTESHAETSAPKSIKDKKKFKLLDKKGLKATESGKRINTVRMLAAQLEHQGEVSDRGRAIVNRMIDNGQTWLSTGGTRKAFRSYGKAASDLVLPLLVNLRSQKARLGGKTLVRVNRSGAITDLGHGHVGLKEIQDYLVLSKNSHVMDDEKRKIFLFYGMSESRDGMELLLSQLQERILRSYPELKPDFGAPSIDLQKLHEVADTRLKFLQTMALQDLQTHMMEKSSQSSDVIQYSRLSLVDAAKDAKAEKTGFVIDERTQLLDMYAVIKDLDGKQVLYDKDAKAAYLDDNGLIHMPLFGEMRDGQTKMLNATLLTVSVQGNVNNVGLQRQINDESLDKLIRTSQLAMEQFVNDPANVTFAERLSQMPDSDEKRAMTDKFYEPIAKHSDHIKSIGEFRALINARNAKGKIMSRGGYDEALEAAKLLLKLGNYLGVNCYGGKDRTGYFVALLQRHYFKEALLKITDISEKTLKKRIKSIGDALVSDESLALQVSYENNGHRILKVSPYHLELMKGAKRITGYMSVAKPLVKKGKVDKEAVVYEDPYRSSLAASSSNSSHSISKESSRGSLSSRSSLSSDDEYDVKDLKLSDFDERSI